MRAPEWLSSKDEPKASIIVPTHNTAAYIGEAIESCLRQTLDSYELIVVDDGSTDDTCRVLKPFEHRIRYVYQQRAGVSAARNRGLQLARGEYVVFLDADDVLLPTKLFEQVTYLDNQPSIGCLHSGWHLIDERGVVIGTQEPWRKTPRLDLEAWVTWQPIFLPAMMFRRHWLERAEGFDPTLRQAEDVDLLLRMSLMGCPCAWLPNVAVCYRQHGRNTIRNTVQRAQSVNHTLARFFARRDLPGQIRRLENTVRFGTLMWCVWILYCAGHMVEIPAYLCESLAFTTDPLERTVQRWLGHFIMRCETDKGYEIESLTTLWPLFKASTEVDERTWKQIERRLNWLIHVESRMKSSASEASSSV